MHMYLKKVRENFKDMLPYFIKLSNNLERIFPNLNSIKFKESNANFVIKMSKRGFIYKHEFESIKSYPPPLKIKYF